MDFLFSKKQIDAFIRFEEWILDHHHVIYGDDCDETKKYWCDRHAIKRQILNGLVKDIFSESSDDLLKIFQANINLELVRRSQKRKS